MKYLSLLALLVISHCAMAEQGLVVEISIEEHAAQSQDVTISVSKIVMGFNESVSLDVEGDYGVTIVSEKSQASKVNLVVSLSDQSNGAPELLGDKSLKLNVGNSANYQISHNDHSYKVTIDTRYGELPAVEEQK
ncbi:hypothetical protein [Shewanella sp. MEBiC00475]|uniref:hypothetical protein n=1 Tax=Shewanella sp. MEBiC00475 TaxID=2575361 RepID=UPI0010BFBC2E|nr:hypothetical protein [Shewanella sp. MEBiC00475]